MKKRTKIISIIMCVLFAFAIFVSCKSNDGKEDTTTNNAENNANENIEETTVDDGLLHDKVPALDFGGYEYRIFFCEYGDVTGVYFYPEAEEGEVLNDAFYKRNQKIEDRFNVKLKSTVFTGSYGTTAANFTKNVQAGDDAYDTYMMVDREAHWAAGRGQLYPMGDLPYIDLSQPYWMQDINSQLTINNTLYWAFSDESLSLFENTLVVYFNKKTAQNLQLEDFYSLVRTGEWTADKFFEYAKMGIRNVSGKDKMSVNEDYWGIISRYNAFSPNFWIGAGISTIEKDENDIPYFSLPGNEKFFAIAEKVFDNITIDGIYLETNDKKFPAGNDYSGGVGYFKDGHAFFLVGYIQDMIRLRDMDDDFGVLPFPKYDAAQSRYYARIEAGRPFVIPATNQRPDIAGAVMEAMACETYNTVFPAYYEFALKNKFARDPDTCEMLDLIRETSVYELGDTIWCENVRDPITQIFKGKKNTLASWVEKNQTKIEKSINDVIEAILNAN